MAHSTQVVYLIGLHFLYDAYDIGRIGQIAIMELEPGALFMRVYI